LLIYIANFTNIILLFFFSYKVQVLKEEKHEGGKKRRNF
jgi:hypothetical protein